MMKSGILKPLSLILCGVMLLAAIGATVFAASESKNVQTKSVLQAPEDVQQTEEKAPMINKDETVYVIAGADGSVKKIIVSDWLQNTLGSAALTDRSELTGIENVKGDEGYRSDKDDQYIWDANGKDIYYQGTIEKALPVSMAVHYTLDGKTVSPAELAGKSGKVTITFDYQSNLYQTVTIAGNEEKIYLPFAILTGMLLSNDVFTNVTVSGGKLINDGDKTVVVGIAFPGLAENLAIDAELFEIPSKVTVTADVKNFSMMNTVSVATNEIFNMIDTDSLGAINELPASLAQLTDAMGQLLTGSAQLSEGITALKVGLDTLVSNNDALNAGAKQVFDSLLSMAEGQLTAAGLTVPALTIENYGTVLSGVIASLEESAVRAQAEAAAKAAVSDAVKANVEQQVTAAVQAQVTDGVLASMGMTRESYEAGVAAGMISAEQQAQVNAAIENTMNAESTKQTVAGAVEAQMNSDEIKAIIDSQMASPEVTAQIEAALAKAAAGKESISALKGQLDSYNQFYTGLAQYTEGVAAADAGAAQLEAGAQQIAAGLNLFYQEGIAKLVAVFNNYVGNIPERVAATLSVSKSYRSFSGITDEMSGSVKFIYRTDSIDS